MINWKPESIDEYRDVQTIYNYSHKNQKKTPQQRLEMEWRSSRDNARTPVQWDDSPNAGFTTGQTPWMNVNPNYSEINVAQQLADPDSILNFYKKAIALRKELKSVRHGVYREYYSWDPHVYCYSRETKCEKILVYCSFSDKPRKLKVPAPFDLTQAQLLLGNYEVTDPSTLKPYECRVYRMK